MSGFKVDDAESRMYLEEHGLDKLFKDMLTCILEERPADPLSYMSTGLERVRRARRALAATTVTSSQLPSSYLHFFHSSSFYSAADIEDGSASARGEELDIEGMAALSERLRQQHLAEAVAQQQPLPCDFPSGRRQSVSAESYQPQPVRDSDLLPALRKESVAVRPAGGPNPKSPELKERIDTTIGSNLLFRNLDSEQRARILDAMFERRTTKGEEVIRQGAPGDNFYVVEAGTFAVLVDGRQVDVLGPGTTFGELALMYNTPRAATVVSQEDGGVLWAVDRETFRRAVIDVAFKKRRLYEAFLKSVPLLSTLTPLEVARIADALETIDFGPGDLIVKKGDHGDAFYMIVSGEARVTTGPDAGGEELNRLGPGEYFGELALLNESPRSASVVAATEVKCVSLSASAFRRLLGPLTDILKRNQEKYKQFVQ